mmetsp:Transcript_10335/g.9974  ORF Transcript_10335/g.9974 Transcript_10335/m.9974 type:complete len:143 (+) Transcript_10335:163-591(+)
MDFSYFESLSNDNTWRNAFGATLLISFVPNIILVAIPASILVKNGKKIYFQHVLLSFAAGALLGDVFIHSLPHLLIKDHHHKNINNGEYDHYDEKNEHNDEDHFHAMYISLLVLVGFLVFFITEKLATYHMLLNSEKNEKKK